MQKIIAVKSSSIVQNEMEPINARMNRQVYGRYVARTTIENTMNTADATITAAEYLRRLKQVGVRHLSSEFPHLNFITAVTINKMTAKNMA
jgi:galactitol-specific phosphotransferase system IIB component